MRSHFRGCLENRKLTMFPAASEHRKVEDEVTKNYEFDILSYLSDAGDQEEDGAMWRMWRMVPP